MSLWQKIHPVFLLTMQKILHLVIFCILHAGIFAQEFEEHYINADGINLYCKTMGKGEPIIFVHGGPGLNHTYFLPYFEKLSKRNTLVFYDQRSSGKSGLSVKATMNFETFASDIDIIREYFGFNKVHIIAHSWGSLVAAQYGKMFPDNVASLIMCNSIPLNHQFDTVMQKEVQARTTAPDSIRRSQILGSNAYKTGEPEAIKSLLYLAFKLNFCDTMFLEKMQLEIPANYAVAALSYQGWSAEMRNYDFTRDVSFFSFPVLIIHGQCDIIPLNSSELTQSLIPKSKMLVFSASGHYSFVEQPDESVKVIRRFLKSVKN